MLKCIDDKASVLRGGIGAEEQPTPVIRPCIERVQACSWGDKEAAEPLSKVEFFPKVRLSEEREEEQSVMDNVVL